MFELRDKIQASQFAKNHKDNAKQNKTKQKQTNKQKKKKYHSPPSHLFIETHLKPF